MGRYVNHGFSECDCHFYYSLPVWDCSATSELAQECLKVLSVCIAVYLRWEHMPQCHVSAGKSLNHVLGWFHFNFFEQPPETLQVS